MAASVLQLPWLQCKLVCQPHIKSSIRTTQNANATPSPSSGRNNCSSTGLRSAASHTQTANQHHLWTSRSICSTFWGASISFASHVRPSRDSRSLRITAVMKESQTLAMGIRAPDFRLPEPLTGRMWSLEDFADKSALLVMFISNHCPFVKHLKPSMKEIADEYMAKGVAVVAIASNSILTHPQDGPDEMVREAKLFKYPFPYLHDEAQEVAKSYRAACTPDFYVFQKEGRQPFQLVYHGQWDESRPSNGKPVTGQDIRTALDLVLLGQPVSPLQRPSIGCNIKWHPGKEPEYF